MNYLQQRNTLFLRNNCTLLDAGKSGITEHWTLYWHVTRNAHYEPGTNRPTKYTVEQA